MKYRRCYRNGGTYFFTVVTDKRQKILTDDA
ncbi:TPA: transposase, partial [Neisseria meningitidis]